LHTIVMIRETWHEPTRRDVARRIAEGESDREIRRCLERTVTRGLFRLLTRTVLPTTGPGGHDARRPMLPR
jgi:hypothetical protein